VPELRFPGLFNGTGSKGAVLNFAVARVARGQRAAACAVFLADIARAVGVSLRDLECGFASDDIVVRLRDKSRGCIRQNAARSGG
jgi:hypothetical protein